MTPVVVGFYARVSTEEQRERSTINAQVDYARKRAEAEGWKLRLFLDDGVSGTIRLGERPAGAEILRAAAAKEITVAATYKLDRLGRVASIIQEAVEDLQRLGIPYRSLTEPFDTATAAGTLFMQMLSAFAQFDRATFLERSRAGTERVARQEGRWLGGIVPFGYRKRADLTLEIDERKMAGLAFSQADVVREMFRRCAEDGWSTQRIADDLNARKVPTVYVRDGREPSAGEIYGTRAHEGKRKRRTAGTWGPGAVLRILKNETYAGQHRYGRRSPSHRELIVRVMPAVVSPALFERVQRQIKANIRWLRTHPKRTYILRGLLTCACGHLLIGGVYPTNGGEVEYYRCVSHPKGQRIPNVKATDLAAPLWADVVSFFEHPDEVLQSVVRGKADASKDEDRAERELLSLAGELRALDAQEARALDAHVREVVSPAVLGTKVAEINTAREAIRERMAEVRDARARAARSAEESVAIRSMLSTLSRRARDADAQTRAEILRALVKRTRVERTSEGLRVQVTYAFAPSVPLAAIPSTDTGSEDRHYRQEIRRDHVLVAH